jgi:1-acyl-sn-glycerol-3-phosphate acyltransferase
MVNDLATTQTRSVSEGNSSALTRHAPPATRHPTISPLWYRLNFCTVGFGFSLLFSMRTQGYYNIPGRGPVLIIANHESYLDPLLVGLAVRRRVRILARKTLFRNRLFGSYISSAGVVPLDHHGFAREGLKVSAELLQAGEALLLFPEGERTHTGQMSPFKPGILLLMKQAKAPILPVGVAGSWEAYPRGALFPKLAPIFWPSTGAALAASIGPLIPPEQFEGLGREEILTTLHDAVAEQVRRAEQLCRDRPPSNGRLGGHHHADSTGHRR